MGVEYKVKIQKYKQNSNEIILTGITDFYVFAENEDEAKNKALIDYKTSITELPINTDLKFKIKLVEKNFSSSLDDMLEYKLKNRVDDESNISKEDLINFCNENNIEIKKRMTKTEIADILLSGEQDIKTLLYKKFKSCLGVSSNHFEIKFNVNHYQIKKMEKKGILKIAHTKEFTLYKKTQYQPFYDTEQYFLNNDEFNKLIEKSNIRKSKQ